MNFLDYNEFVNESKYDFERRSVAQGSPMTPALTKSLSRLGKSFKSDKDIIKVIELLGFRREPLKPNSTSAEYIFVKDRDENLGPLKYITYSSGYVRAEYRSYFMGRLRGGNNVDQTPVSDQFIPTTRDRLLLVLRRALKQSELYPQWLKMSKSSDISVEEFIEKKKPYLISKRFGL
jgi:hypothetical protein